MIHYFHGFLGSQEDFDLVQPKGTSHSLFNLESIKIESGDILVGYSLGGRVALDLALKNNFQIKKLILIASHPGLEKNELEERKIAEEKIINLMNKYSKEDFLNIWNKLPLFEGDPPLTSNSFSQEENLKLFLKYRLSLQPNYKDLIISNRSKVVYVVGEKDQKYAEIAKDFFVKEKIKTYFLPTSHRIIKYPKLLNEILLKECE